MPEMESPISAPIQEKSAQTTWPTRILTSCNWNRATTHSDFLWAIGISAFMGALYGIFVSPLWSEAVEFGQAWAGLVPYDCSPWGVTLFAMPSLQITVPALLLHAGFQIWTLCLATTAFFCSLAFAAVAGAGFAFSRSL